MIYINLGYSDCVLIRNEDSLVNTGSTTIKPWIGTKEHSKKMLLLVVSTLQTQLFHSNIDVDMSDNAYLDTDLLATLGELI